MLDWFRPWSEVWPDAYFSCLEVLWLLWSAVVESVYTLYVAIRDLVNLKVTAFVCMFIAFVLLLISICSSTWLTTDNFRKGLFQECEYLENGDIDCHDVAFTAWIVATAALCILSLTLTFFSTILCGVGLSTKDTNKKFIFYRICMYIMFFCVLLMICALVVFPVMFTQSIDHRGTKWYFAWAYGVAWGATIFMLGAAILLYIDKESEEIFYQEKTYYNEQSDA